MLGSIPPLPPAPSLAPLPVSRLFVFINSLLIIPQNLFQVIHDLRVY